MCKDKQVEFSSTDTIPQLKLRLKGWTDSPGGAEGNQIPKGVTSTIHEADTVGFGQYKELTYRQCFYADIGWTKWAVLQYESQKAFPLLARYGKWAKAHGVPALSDEECALSLEHVHNSKVHISKDLVWKVRDESQVSMGNCMGMGNSQDSSGKSQGSPQEDAKMQPTKSMDKNMGTSQESMDNSQDKMPPTIQIRYQLQYRAPSMDTSHVSSGKSQESPHEDDKASPMGRSMDKSHESMDKSKENMAAPGSHTEQWMLLSSSSGEAKQTSQ